MSSGPDTALDNLTVADGYLDEAFAFGQVSLTDSELYDLTIAKDFLRKVIDAVVARENAGQS